MIDPEAEKLIKDIDVDEDDLSYCLSALMSLDKEEVRNHDNYIRMKLLELFEKYYEGAKPTVASEMRKAICRIDELLFAED